VTDSGNFAQGLNGAIYTVQASNYGGVASTSGTLVTVAVGIPGVLTATAISGNGWTCTSPSNNMSCSRSDALVAGGTYPPITVTVNVPPTAPTLAATTAIMTYGNANPVTFTDETSIQPKLASPKPTPAAGTYYTPQNVTLRAASGASISYNISLDGGNTWGPSLNYTITTPPAPPTNIPVTVTTTIRAYASETGFATSDPGVATYTIMPPAAPTYSLTSGTYLGTQSVTLSTATPGASIRYTTDGTTPTQTNGVSYTPGSPILVRAPVLGGNVVIQAIAYQPGGTNSPVSPATYTIMDFLLGVSCSPCSVAPGVTAYYTITATPQNGFNATITLAPITATPTPNSWYPVFSTMLLLPGAWSATFAANTNSTTAQNGYTLHFSGTSTPITHSADAQLSVSTTTQYYLTTLVAPQGSGTISPASGWYNPGAPVTFTASPLAGNTFTGFTNNGIPSQTNPMTLVMTGTMTVVANFSTSSSTYTISGRVVQSDGSALNGSTVVLSGAQSATTTADTNGNYWFTVPSGNYTATASSPYGAVTPSVRTYVINANVTGQDYYIVPFSLSANPIAGRDCTPPTLDCEAPPDQYPPTPIPADGQPHMIDYWFYDPSANSRDIQSPGCWTNPKDSITTTYLADSSGPHFTITFTVDPAAARTYRDVICRYGGQNLASITGIVGIDVPTPVITSVQPCTTAQCSVPPASITPGDEITITGYNFGQGGTLKLCALDGTGCIAGSYDTWSSDGTQVTASISQPPGTYAVQIEYNAPAGYFGFLSSSSSAEIDSNLWEVDVQAATCAVPVNIQQLGQGSDTGNGTLHFDYSYVSSTGNPNDLAGCTVGERVVYLDANNQPSTLSPFKYPLPFSDLLRNTGASNPTVRNFDPGAGITDDQETPGPFVKPYVQTIVKAMQYYRYYCTCKNNGAWQSLAGPIWINRSVDPNSGGTWRFTVCKTNIVGATAPYSCATINPLP